ncbi:Hypothetical predicted protein, partial [Pelobates cultripes]
MHKKGSHTQAGGQFPADSLAAIVMVIPKEGKDPANCSSFRSISLPCLRGSLRSCWASYTLTKLGLSQAGKQRTIPYITSSTPQGPRSGKLRSSRRTPKRAFDPVDWAYVGETLQHMGFGPHLRSWVSALYTIPTARIHIKGSLTKPFP